MRCRWIETVFEQRGSPIESGPTLQFAAEGDKMVATHVALPGQDTPLRKAKIYLLVSNRTASAAEHFSLAMKSTGRLAVSDRREPWCSSA